MIRELHEKLKAGTVTATALAGEYLARIKEKDREIGAYLSVFEETVLNQASQIDEKIARGEEIDLLEGIPGALKDNLTLAGSRTTAGSRILENYIAPYDATVVARLREKGALFLGKTNQDEFAMGSSTENSAYQKTKNPHDLSRVPGGSSGGSAAAVAGDMAVWALGSDTGGSIRQPASFCGLVGLKPTYGRVSRYGLIAMASSLDQVGTFTQTVEDAAIVLSRIAGHDRYDATTAEAGGEKPFEDFISGGIQGLRIGVPKEYMDKNLDGEIRKLVEASLEHLKVAGAEVIPVSLPHSAYALPAYYIIMPAEVSSNLARFDGIRYGVRPEGVGEDLLSTYLETRAHGFGREVKRRIMLGTYTLSAGYYDAYYAKAQKVRSLIRQDFEKAFEEVDVLFSPTAPETAFPLGAKTADPLKMYLSDIYTVTANLAGIPALSLPIGKIGGLPVGGQLMGKWFDEETLLRAGHVLEESLKNKE